MLASHWTEASEHNLVSLSARARHEHGNADRSGRCGGMPATHVRPSAQSPGCTISHQLVSASLRFPAPVPPPRPSCDHTPVSNLLLTHGAVLPRDISKTRATLVTLVVRFRKVSRDSEFRNTGPISRGNVG